MITTKNRRNVMAKKEAVYECRHCGAKGPLGGKFYRDHTADDHTLKPEEMSVCHDGQSHFSPCAFAGFEGDGDGAQNDGLTQELVVVSVMGTA